MGTSAAIHLKKRQQPTQGGKEFSYDHIMREVVTFAKSTDSRINIRMIPQRRALKGILLLFIEPYATAAQDLEKCINPDITKVGVTVNGSPNKVYNNGIEAKNLWQEISQYVQPKKVSSKTDLPWFYTDNKFRLFIDLRSMADTTKQESGVLYC